MRRLASALFTLALTASFTVQAAQSATALTLEEVESHVEAMSDALTLPTLQTAYLAAHEHAKQARDVSAKKRFTEVYNLRAEDIKSHPMEAQS